MTTILYRKSEEYILQLEFESNYNDNEEILIEPLDADACQRQTLQRDSISPISFERAMTVYIANKLNMTVDTDIFRGGIPVNMNGCGVTIIGKTAQNDLSCSHYQLRISYIDNSRDKTIKMIHDLEVNFPAYGENVSLDGGESLTLKAIINDDLMFSDEITDQGKIKLLGELLLTVII